ncbi:hypothetical protein AMK59_6311 [Oryctes borbonicus]|uniref:EGF-like domain-containing protein n=1 Tax=Oryctes borbonicus TaxID=1629725 RepID=A0A0T6B2L5_9SCAR|nr:hypothetical protein AMK59_6311 [Oryctes borbonicus]
MCKQYLIWSLCGLTLSFVIVSVLSVSSEAPSLSMGKINRYFSYSYYCLLYNDTGNSTIVWIPSSEEISETEYGYDGFIYCTINRDSYCNLENASGLTFQHAYNNFPLTLNQLWQGFDVVKLSLYRSFSKKIDYPDNFQVSFSFRMDNVDILLCEEVVKGLLYHRCYYLTLGGSVGKASFLRKCQTGEINVESTENCSLPLIEIHKDTIINSKEWHHFSIIKKQNTYTLSKYGWQTPALSYTDNSTSPFLPKYVLLQGYKKEGLAKIHEVNAFAFEKSTLAKITLQNRPRNGVIIFVKACENCIVAISLQDGDKGTLLYSTQTTQSDGGWQQVVLKTEKRRSLRIVAAVSNFGSIGGEEKWYISDTIRELQDNDIVSLTAQGQGCCHALTHPQYKICTYHLSKYDPGDQQCASNSIGRNCIPCESIFHSGNCQPNPICDLMADGNVRCSCPAGLHGNYCENKCKDGSYGFDCRRKCGHCRDLCEAIDGTCKGCRDNFKGKRCDTRNSILSLFDDKEIPQV